MSLPLLRETRMPAVLCRGRPGQRSWSSVRAVIARAVVDSLAEWVDTAWD